MQPFRKPLQLCFCVLFLLVLCAPVVLTLCLSPQGLSLQAPESHNPFRVADAQLKSWTEELWTREPSRRAVAYADFTLFSRSLSENVFIGREDQFFFKGNQAMDNLMGQYQVPEETLSALCDAQQQTSEILSARGIRYVVVILPAKESVYPESIPGIYRREGASGRRAQIIAALQSRTDVEVLDMTDLLLDHKAEEILYLQTDSHWNMHGSFLASQRLVEYLRRDDPRIAPLDAEDYQVHYVDAPGQNLAALSYLEQVVPELNIPQYERTGGWRFLSMESEATYPDPGDPVTLGEITSMIIRENPALPNAPNLMLMGDSFTGWDQDATNYWNVNNFLSESFHRYVKYHYYNAPFYLSLIEKEQSDIVVLMYLENNLEMLTRPIRTDPYPAAS